MPSVCLPIFPVFPISLIMPNKLTSNGLELTFTVKRLDKDSTLDLDKITVEVNNSVITGQPDKYSAKHMDGNQIILKAKENGYHYLHL